MIWIFASVVLVCAIVYPGFRKVCLWIGGIVLFACVLILAAGIHYKG